MGRVGRISGKSEKCFWEEWEVFLGRVGSVNGNGWGMLMGTVGSVNWKCGAY